MVSTWWPVTKLPWTDQSPTLAWRSESLYCSGLFVLMHALSCQQRSLLLVHFFSDLVNLGGSKCLCQHWKRLGSRSIGVSKLSGVLCGCYILAFCHLKPWDAYCWVKRWNMINHFHSCTHCHMYTYKCSITPTLAAHGIAVLGFVMSWRLLSLKVLQSCHGTLNSTDIVL